MASRTSIAEWKALEEHYKQASNFHMRELFTKDPERFKKFQ
jgi:hypothetical protein